MEAEADLQESDEDDQKLHLFVEVTSTCCPSAKRDEQELEAAAEPIGAFTARGSKVELQEKLRIYEERAKQQPQDAGAHWSLGGLRLALGNFAGAEGAYAEAVRLEPGDEFARFGLGQAREKQGKLAAAAEAYAAAQHLGYDGGEALNRVSKELERKAAVAIPCIEGYRV
ncbi:unnamed protein product [Symbiodinium necroappetens]|uniref:Uncharacterized protein n=1 Tax=Symbiodinium necroappetens TaxID=1628268 RepID=A0A812Y2X2_9DINO|nr:unnamed protein product [Symbiodinium necroappetens]